MNAVASGLLVLTLSACGHIKGGVTSLLGSNGSNIALRPDQINISVSEGTTVLFAVALSDKRSQNTLVHIALSNVEGGSTDDIQGLPSSVTIPSGTLSKLITFNVPTDSTYEGPESFKITLSTDDEGVSVEEKDVTVHVTDVDPVPVVSLSAATQNVAESVGTGTITVNMTPRSAKTVSMPYTFADGTATSGSDYTATNGTLTFAPGETSKTMTFSVTDDASPEVSETFTVTLGTPVGDATLGATSQQTVSILDNDTTFPAFNITGVTSGTDSAQDAVLNGGVSPTLNWEDATGAASYDVTIYASDGTTVVCATQNTITSVLSFAPVACALTGGQSYKAKVVAKNADNSYTLDAANNLFDFLVNRAPTAVDDGPLYLMSGGALSFDPRADNPATGAADADADADGHSLTITAKTDGAKGTVAITGGGTGLTYTPGASETGSDSFTYTVNDGNGGTATATVSVRIMTAHTWTGQVSSSWNTGGNWCGAINGSKTGCSGGTVPNGTQTAIFDDTCSGTDCDALIDVPINVKGIRLDSGYTGTITQGATSTLTIGSDGYSQKAGSFVGDSTTFYDSGAFDLSGGSFKSTSEYLTVDGDLTIAAAAAFNANGGTLMFTSSSASVNVGSKTFQNVRFYHASGSVGRTITGSLNAAGDLTVDVASNFGLYTGTISVGGNVTLTSGGGGGDGLLKIVGAGTRTITGSGADLPSLEIASTGTVNLSGTIKVNRDYTQTSGTVNSGSSTLVLGCSGCSLVPGTVTYNHVKFEGPGSVGYTVTGTMNVNGNFTANAASNFGIDTGTVAVKGDVILTSGTGGGTGLLKLNGSGTQTVTGVAAALPSFEIASTGTVNLAGTIPLNGNFTYSSGTVNAGTSTVVFQNSGTISSGAMSFNDVKFESIGSAGGTIVGTMKIAGDLTCDVTGNCDVNGGTVAIGGDVTMASGSISGSATTLFNGTGNQTITPTVAGWFSGTVTVNKVSGNLILAGPVAWNAAGQTLAMTSGVLDMDQRNLTVTALTMATGTKIFRGCSGVLTVGGSTPPDGNYDNGVIVGGDPTYLSIDDVTVAESGTNAVFTVSLDQANCGAVSVNYATANGTATAGSDYTSTSGTLNFAIGDLTKTVSVPITQDAMACEGNETFSVGLSAATNSLISDNSGAGTITDDDAANISIDDVAVIPGVAAVFTISRSNTCGNNTTVSYTTSDDTAAAGTDYTAASGTATIASAGASTTVTVTTASNPSLASSRAFKIQLSGNSEGTITDNEGVGTIAAPVFDFDLTTSLTSTLNGHTATLSRASTATYFDADRILKVATIDAPRFDHDPSTGKPLGLLIEAARTNIFTYSQDLTNSVWNKGLMTATANAVTAPDGSVSASRVVETTANGIHYIDRYMGSQTVNTSWAMSAFVKANGRSMIMMTLSEDGVGGYFRARFDLATKTVLVTETDGNAVMGSAYIKELPNGWFRISMNGVPNSSGTTAGLTASMVFLTSTYGDTYAGNISSGFYIWGLQLEQGDMPTSYIPTGTATLTRAADTVNTSNVAWHSLSRNTYVATAYLANSAKSSHQTLFNQTDASGDEAISVRRDSNTEAAYYVQTGNVAQASNSGMGVWSAGETKTVAVAAAQNNFAAAVNGTVQATDTNGNMPTAISSLRIGRVNTTEYLNGHLSRLKFYQHRLNDASLQALSAADARPTLSIEDATANEGGTLTFTVKLSHALSPAAALTLNWTASDGTATLASDVSGATGGTVTIPSGGTSATFTITTNDDSTVEDNETLSVALSGVPATVVSGDLNAIGTIVDAPLNFNFVNYPTSSGVAVPANLTFSRASSGTYFDANGVMKTSTANLFRFSSDLKNTTGWSRFRLSLVPNSVAAPSGDFDALKMVEDTTNNVHTIEYASSGTLGLSDNTLYTYSAYVKAGERKNFELDVQNKAGVWGWGMFDLTSATATTCFANAGYTPTCAITAVGGGWYRVSFSFDSKSGATTPRFIIGIGTDASTYSYTGNGSSGAYIWGPQLEVGTAATSYIPTTSTISYAPRYDHDPATCVTGTLPSCARAPLGLLMEPSSTNKLLYSDQFQQAAWQKWQTGVTTNTGAVTAPDGTTTADLLYDLAVTDQHDFQQSVSISAGTVHTWSVYARKPATNGRRYLSLALCSSTGADCSRILFDLDTGAASSPETFGTAVLSGYSSQALGDGWYRLRMTGTAGTTSTTMKAYLILNTSGTTNYTYAGDGASGVYIWGAQLEAASIPSSYIPTTTVAVTRNLDLLRGNNFYSWYRDTWSSFVDFSRPVYEPVMVNWAFLFAFCRSSSCSNNRISAYYDTNSASFESDVWESSSRQGSSAVSGAPTAGTVHQLGVSYAASPSSLQTFRDGASGSVSSTFTGSVLDMLAIGGDAPGSGALGGHIRKFQFVPRALNNSQMTTLTTD